MENKIKVKVDSIVIIQNYSSQILMDWKILLLPPNIPSTLVGKRCYIFMSHLDTQTAVVV